MIKRKKFYTNRSFVMLGRAMLRSQEWRCLSPSAKFLYIHLKAKHNGSNNGQIRLYYSELKGIKGLSSSSTVSAAFKELEKKEWIKRKKLGGLHRFFNEYELTGKYDDHLT